MIDLKFLENVRFVTDKHGKKSAVQMDIKAWKVLIRYLEELEDRSLVKEKLAKLSSGPQTADALPWDQVSSEW